jgi:hypothetical protein
MSLNVKFYVIACCLGSLAEAKVPLAVPEAMTAEHRAERNAFVTRSQRGVPMMFGMAEIWGSESSNRVEW